MSTKIRVTHLGSNGLLNVRTMRQDVAAGEPASLGDEVQIAPGDAVVLAVYAGCALVLTPVEQVKP